jgi:hypothetical protein
VSPGIAELLLSGGGGVALAVLVHWHLGALREAMADIRSDVAVLLDRVGRGEAPPA